MAQKKPIIVTGSHRSGTTWVGKTLSLTPTVRYIHEPFNIDEKRDHPLKYWYEYVSDKSPKDQRIEIYRYLDGLFYFNYHGLRNQFKEITGIRDIYRYLFDSVRKTYQRPLMKDPLCLMSADWIAEQFSANVVVIIRHPAAFILSIKEKGWKHNFNHFDRQESLMEKLFPFADKVRNFNNNPQDIIDQGILLWNLVHYRIHQYQTDYPKWIFIKHEDLSRDPVSEFKQLYQSLDINYNRVVEQKIIESTTTQNETRLKRDSKKNIGKWKNKLSDPEINRIKEGTKNIANNFYTESDW